MPPLDGADKTPRRACLNPKHERNPNSEIRDPKVFRLETFFRREMQRAISGFGIRISGLIAGATLHLRHGAPSTGSARTQKARLAEQVLGAPFRARRYYGAGAKLCPLTLVNCGLDCRENGAYEAKCLDERMEGSPVKQTMIAVLLLTAISALPCLGWLGGALAQYAGEDPADHSNLGLYFWIGPPLMLMLFCMAITFIGASLAAIVYPGLKRCGR